MVDLVETYAAAQSDPAAFHKLPLFHFIQLILRAVGTAHAEVTPLPVTDKVLLH